jgi:hypothetical protein
MAKRHRRIKTVREIYGLERLIGQESQRVITGNRRMRRTERRDRRGRGTEQL